MAARFSQLVVDARDPQLIAQFWCDVLGWRVTGTEDDGSVEIAGEDAAAVSLLFEPVPEDKVVKNRLHIDVRPVGVEQDVELQRLLALGAVHADVGQGEQTWFVLADPEGNEFCLLRGH